MSSPSDSSGSESSSSSSSRTMSLSEFNPFATHHFTSCTTSSKSSDNRPHPSYGYPYGPSAGSYNAHSTSRANPTYSNTSIAAPTPTSPSRQPTQAQRGQPIFTPFRKETASPDLSDILKSNKKSSYSQSSTSSSTSSSKPIAAPVPVVASRKF